MRLMQLSCLCLLLGGCGAVDSYGTEQHAKDAVAKLLIDPGSADFEGIAERAGHVCGQVNAKNSMGAYVGFRRFVVDATDWNAEIDPQFDYSDLIDADALCASMLGNEYSTASTTASACESAEEKRSASLAQDKFNSAWNSDCVTSPRRPFQPPLAADQVERPPPVEDLAAPVSESVTEPAEENAEEPAAPDVNEQVANDALNVDDINDGDE